jgi:hypothetical protein
MIFIDILKIDVEGFEDRVLRGAKTLLNNKFGFVIGDASGGPEIVHIEESLGYLDDEDEDDNSTRSTHHANTK